MTDEIASPFRRVTPPGPTDPNAPSPFRRPATTGPATAETATMARPTAASPTPAREEPTPAGTMTPNAMAAAPAGNVTAGCAAGLVAALVGAAAWAAITVLTKYQIGWMAVGVGALVGVAVRKAGHGRRRGFGLVGAALALLGCLTGNFLTGCLIVARQLDAPVASVFARLTPALVGNLLIAMFDPIDLLFYGLALSAGYRLSIVRDDAAR